MYYRAIMEGVELDDRVSLDVFASQNGGYAQNVSNFTIPLPEIYHTSQIFLFYSLTILIPFGLVANTISFITFMSALMRRHSSSWYLAALGFTDNLVLATEILRTWMPSPQVGLEYYNNYYVACSLSTYLSMVGRFVSSWLIVLFTVERAYCVVRPITGKYVVFNVRLAKILILLVFIVGAFISMYIFFLVEIITLNASKICVSKAGWKEVYSGLTYAMIGLSTLLPAVILIALNSLIIYKLAILRRERSRIFKSGHDTNALEKNRITVMLLSVSSFYVLVNLPYQVCWVVVTTVPSIPLEPFYVAQSVLSIIRVFYMLNFGANLLLYSVSGTRFRAQMRHVFCCGPEPRDYGDSRGSLRRQSSATESAAPLRRTSLYHLQIFKKLKKQHRLSVVPFFPPMNSVDEEAGDASPSTSWMSSGPGSPTSWSSNNLSSSPTWPVPEPGPNSPPIWTCTDLSTTEDSVC